MNVRIVSLVPSLTETLWDLNVGDQVVGVTKFCTRPARARTTANVIGGTKDPSIVDILSLKPDLVVADEDENKPEHIAALRNGGVRVHVTRISGIDDAAREIVTIGRLLGRGIEAEGWAQRIRQRRADVSDLAALGVRFAAFVPIWRKPLMTLNGETYIADMLSAVGVENVFHDATKKYFEVDVDDVKRKRPVAIVLPTEPFRFTRRHADEMAASIGLDPRSAHIIDGQALTWFGTRTAKAIDDVARQVAQVRSHLENA